MNTTDNAKTNMDKLKERKEKGFLTFIKDITPIKQTLPATDETEYQNIINSIFDD